MASQDENSDKVIDAVVQQQTPPLDPRDRYLQRYPFREDELDAVLAAYNSIHHHDVSLTETSHSSISTANEILLSDLVTWKSHVNSSHFNLVKRVEEQIVSLHVSQQLVQIALDTVVLVNCENDDVERWLEAVATLSGRRGPRSLLSLIFHVAVTLDQSKEEGGMSAREETATPLTLATLIHRWIVAASEVQQHWRLLGPVEDENNNEATAGQLFLTCVDDTPPQSWIASLRSKCKPFNSDQNSTSRLDFSSWMEFANWTAPQVAATVSSFCHLCWWGPDRATSLSLPRYELPYSPNPQEPMPSAIWAHHNVMAMSLGLLGLGGEYRRLYSSDLDGNHFNIFQQALQGYHGKTVLLIQTTSAAVFGYYTECPWRISQTWYGDESDAFLFRLAPALDLYGRIDESGSTSSHVMYLNPTPLPTRARKAEDAISGLAIGGIADHIPRLHISKSFENCKAYLTDKTYRPGPLLENEEIFFDIDTLEVYAIHAASDQAFEASCVMGQKKIAVQEALRVKIAKVTDRTPFLIDCESEYNVSKIYNHRDQVRGRHDFVANDSQGHGYFHEDKPPSVQRR